ncbi:MAG: hypothetical protein KTR33_15425, partial [Gammaproteobacteria bacterium]|nr:hypothetical protein [Gammaproteobacteria bacterium]
DNGLQSPNTATSPISIANTEEWEIDNIRSEAPGKSDYATPEKTASTFKTSPLLLVLTVFILVGATALYYFSQLSPDDTLDSAKTTSTAATAPLNQPDASPSTNPNASKKSESLHLVATAFENADMSAVKTLVDLSPRYEQVLASLFRQFSSIELAAIDSTSTDTVLTIVRMKRATGTYAVPAASFRHLVLTPPDPQRPEYKWKL